LIAVATDRLSTLQKNVLANSRLSTLQKILLGTGRLSTLHKNLLAKWVQVAGRTLQQRCKCTTR
jgi:hypothetical protein